MRLGAKLRELRESQRKSLKEVAEKANLSIAQLSKLELGDRGLDVEVFVNIAKALGHQPGDLLPNSAGLFAEFRPFLARLSAVPEASRPVILGALAAVLDVREDALSYMAPPAPANVLTFPSAQEDRRELSPDAMGHIARVMQEAGIAEPRKAARGKEYEVRFYGLASAGGGVELFDEVPLEHRQIPEYYWKKGARGVLKAAGDSMIDVGIFEHDILFVKPTPRPASGELVICTVNRKVYVKQFKQNGHAAQLISKNPNYPPIDIHPNDEVEFFGVVVGRTGDL